MGCESHNNNLRALVGRNIFTKELEPLEDEDGGVELGVEKNSVRY